MLKYKNIYVAATSQHVGKTTSTLGLVSAYLNKGLNVGYCKPVGQKVLEIDNLKVDKDAVLFADLISFDMKPQYHSPIILGKGATEAFLDDPRSFKLASALNKAEKYLSNHHELVIYEGTGHPGVGSVANMSNARVSKLLDAQVIIVVEGGIGSTIDMLNMCMGLFRLKNVPILGVIINKVIPEKQDKVKHYVGKWLKQKQIDLLGIIPYEQTLAYLIIRTIADAIKGTIEHGHAFANNSVGNILAGSLIDLNELKSSENLLLLVSWKSLSAAIIKIKWLTELYNIAGCPLSGIVITGQGNIDLKTMKYIKANNLPVIRTDLDTYGAVIKISNIEVKINQNTPWKVDKAINLIEQNINLDLILEKSRM